MRAEFRIFKFRKVPLVMLMLVLGWFVATAQLVDDYLTVKGNTKANTVIFSGDRLDYPSAPLEGEMFYNANLKAVHFYDGGGWRSFGPSASIATRIVAASDSLDKNRADYICSGTNDQITIQYALDSLQDNGGAVYLLEGTYNIGAAIHLDSVSPNDAQKSIIGSGAGSVLKLSGGSNFSAISVSNISGVLIAQLAIDGNYAGSYNSGIRFSGVNDSRIDRVEVRNMPSAGAGSVNGAIYFDSSSHNVIVDCTLNNDSWSGIALNNSGQNSICANYITTSASAPIGIGLYSSSNNNAITANIVRGGSSSCGIYLADSSSNIVSGNISNGNNKEGIYLFRSLRNIITANTIQGNSGIGIKLITGSYYNLICGNHINYPSTQSARSYAIYLSASSDNAVNANIIYDESGDAFSDSIRLDADAKRNLISTNSVYDTSGNSAYGINISATTCEDNYLASNSILGSAYVDTANPPTYDRKVFDNGTRTAYTDKLKLTLERQPGAALSVSNGGTITPRGGLGYVPVAGNGAPVTANGAAPIAPGKSPGEILILEGDSAISTNTVTILDSGNVNLGAARTLGAYDTLQLIWNGAKWLEASYRDN